MSIPYCDPSLSTWLSDGANDIREVIVEAHLPSRHILMRRGESGRMVPDQLFFKANSKDRLYSLNELNEFLAGQMRLTTTVLKAAGAIVVRASGADMRRIFTHPLVKAIRPNRKLSI